MTERIRYEIEITDPTLTAEKILSRMLWLRLAEPSSLDPSSGFNWYSIDENKSLLSEARSFVILTGEMTDASRSNDERNDDVLITLQTYFPAATIVTRWLVIDDDAWDDVYTTTPKEKP